MFRRNWIAVEDAYYERQIAADREELAKLEVELKKASAERRARLEAEVRADYRERSDKLHQAWELTKSALR